MIEPMLPANFIYTKDYGIDSWLAYRNPLGLRYLSQGDAYPGLEQLPPGFDGDIVETNSSSLYYIYNYFGDGSPDYLALPYSKRMADAKLVLKGLPSDLLAHLLLLEGVPSSLKGLLEVHQEYKQEMILTHPEAPYLPRQCKASEPHLLRLGYLFGDGTVLRIVKNPTLDQMAALVIRLDNYDTIQCGLGFTKQQRIEVFQNQEGWVGKRVRLKFKLNNSLKPYYNVFQGVITDD